MTPPKPPKKKIKLTPQQKVLKAEEKKKAIEKREKEKEERELAKKKAAEEREKAKEEREKAKEEKELARKLAAERKEKEKEEREKAKEEKEKEKERERQEKERERQEKEREKQEKEREKQEKEMAKRKAIEDKLKAKEEKEMAKKKAEEERNRELAKSKNIMNKFLKIKPNVEKPQSKKSPVEAANFLFKPFQLGQNQTLAQVVPDWVKRKFIVDKFDSSFENQNQDQLYLHELHGGYKPHKGMKRKSFPDIIIESRENFTPDTKICKIKFLQFHDNHRPPYRGTFSKKSKQVIGRRPFAKDKTYLNYEVDSDQEWEEEDEGEDIKSESGSEKGPEDYEIDNEFFVPHGYLSEDEDKYSDENGDKKGKPLVKETVLMAERNKSYAKLYPVAIGCLWKSKNNLEEMKQFQSFKRVSLKNKT